MYVLDEPSIGLHPRDNARLIATLRRLRDLGNSVIVVEHDEETIRAADHVVDFGPGAGHLGGKVIFAGTPDALEKSASLTGEYLSGKRRIEVPDERGAPRSVARHHAARASTTCTDIDVRIPLGVLTAVTGVSGAGKSSLVNGILLPALARALHDSEEPVGAHDAIEGLGALDKVDRHRSAADRAHAALEPRHVHQGVRRHPRHLRRAPRCARARLGRRGDSAST